MAELLDGKRSASRLEAEVAGLCERFADATGRSPGLVVLLVGDDPASSTYVAGKERAAARVGIAAETRRLPPEITTEKLLEEVGALNRAEEVDGILVQLPLPEGVDARQVLDAVDPRKDVDGFHPTNLGRLAQGRPTLAPCTPTGILRLLRDHDVSLEGAEAVVLGRSLIVGKPMALLLLQANATVTICHSRTRELEQVCRRADLLVAAVGRAGMVGAEHVKEGAVVVDVGIHRITDRETAERLWGGTERFARFEERGRLLVGDVDFRAVESKVRAITPVPGGVGPMTVAQLLANSVHAAARRAGVDLS